MAAVERDLFGGSYGEDDEGRWFRQYCTRRAQAFLKQDLDMSSEEATEFIKQHVRWRIKELVLADIDEVRTADIVVWFTFGKRPFTSTLEHHCRARASSCEYYCCFEIDDTGVVEGWQAGSDDDDDGNNDRNLQRAASSGLDEEAPHGSGIERQGNLRYKFVLTAAEVKDFADNVFPDNWRAVDALWFVCLCSGAPQPCNAVEMGKGLWWRMRRLCKAAGCDVDASDE